MKIKKLFTQIFVFSLFLLVFTIFILAVYELNIQSKFYKQEVKKDLSARANLASTFLANRDWEQKQTLDSLIQVLSKSGQVRLTVIQRDGRVLSDSHKDAATMDNHADRPEVKQALQGRVGFAMRHSYTLNEELVYLAIPFMQKDTIAAVVRVAFPYAAYRQSLNDLQRHFLFAGLIVILLTALISYITSRRISKPLENIKEGAQRFARGQFSQPVTEKGTQEIQALANTLNAMAKQLDKRIRTISLQRNEQEAMFRSMKEGILAIDRNERILRINQAAIKFFNIPQDKITHRPVYEVIRNKDMLKFIRRVLESDGYLEEEITVTGDKERVLLLHGDVLLDAQGQTMGTLIVMNNITRIKQLDRMRQEFVANVSHELKTPITSIKGYVETLREGAAEDTETRNRFLDIIARQSERLNAIINDLLQLSKIEQRYGKLDIELQQAELLPVVRSAVSACQQKADDKTISIEMECEASLTAVINPPLLEQALINLLDNAIKYSPTGSKVRISAQPTGQHVRLSVQDWGCGIDQQYHARLFERFFRVDKGRSREMGGTGLGLAIVKHIALALKGSVSVKSAPGEGSIFTLILQNKI